jgi:hypothetical protein
MFNDYSLVVVIAIVVPLVYRADSTFCLFFRRDITDSYGRLQVHAHVRFKDICTRHRIYLVFVCLLITLLDLAKSGTYLHMRFLIWASEFLLAPISPTNSIC